MPRYIDAVLLKEKLLEADKSPYLTEYARLVPIINRTPTADVEEVKHGEWIVEDAGGGWKRAICPRCDKIFLYAKGQLQIHAMPRCPECGAKMDGKENGE